MTGELLREARRRAGLSQSELAARAGVAQSVVSEYEADKRQPAALRIEEYALIGDRRTAALVGSNGTVDWLCAPRFDSGAVFAALLGTDEHGNWELGPARGATPAGRRYRPDSLVLETDLDGDGGRVRLTDAMPVARDHSGVVQVVRLVESLSGTVRIRSRVRPRFDYGCVTPWFRTVAGNLRAVAGPDTLVLDGDVTHQIDAGDAVAEFTLEPGRKVALRMTYVRAGQAAPTAQDLTRLVGTTDRWWRRWAGQCTYDRPYRDAVVRSLITLKALTYAPSGGIVAAATTSLPEQLGGPRNWDYRYCWIRDATFTLLALLDAGYTDEPLRGGSGCCARSRAIPRRCRRCTASTGSAGSLRPPWTTCRGTPTPDRYGWATLRPSSSSSTCTAS